MRASVFLVWLFTALLILAVLTQRWWEPWAAARGFNLNAWPWRWWLLGYPRLAARMWWTWRRLAHLNNLAVSFNSHHRVIGTTVVQGTALRPRPPRLGIPKPTRTGARVQVVLHPGQTPAPFMAAAQAMEHTWRVHAVRVTSPERGRVLLTASAQDPLTGLVAASAASKERLLAVPVGKVEEGGDWLIDLRRTPHWLVTGATRSGKSTLLAALIYRLSEQPVGLVGIDCKGGMELGLFEPRLSALAVDRSEAIKVLSVLLSEVRARMATCRAAGVRSIWDLPEAERPIPFVVIVDELAELYLNEGNKESREESEQCGTLLLRLAQLGAALGVHLIIAGQRVGSDLGVRVTALRAQLGGRIAHRAHDEATAEMTLGDINPDAVTVAMTIADHEQGVAVISTGGRWTRARSSPVTPEQAAEESLRTAHLVPLLPAIHEHQSGGTEGKEL
ncbi:FtsK/SpoIIIE domain-containing protein [Streptomyces cacaoi]|uniref:FtsK/SpoIIIE domain-containing protein n=1 Tax=Streptomyces cacaoi TaxID=1898 RepID=UPI00260853FC|nr:FtsK/SpoIIIE domain-containing protein [Streptomyces cacaoi]